MSGASSAFASHRAQSHPPADRITLLTKGERCSATMLPACAFTGCPAAPAAAAVTAAAAALSGSGRGPGGASCSEQAIHYAHGALDDCGS